MDFIHLPVLCCEWFIVGYNEPLQNVLGIWEVQTSTYMLLKNSYKTDLNMSSHNTAIWLRISSENISCLCDE